MKQRVITAIVLLAVLAVVVWQIKTPVFIIVIAFLSAVASNEIMRCAKVENKLVLTVGTIVAGFIPFTSSATIMEPWISQDIWSKVLLCVPNPTFILAIAVIITYFLTMLKNYSTIRFEQIAIAVFASVIVPYGFSIFGIFRDINGLACQYGIYLIFYALICALGTDVGAQLGGMAFGKHKMSPNISPKKTVEGAVCGIIFSIILNVTAVLLYNHFANAPLEAYQMAVLLALSPVTSFLGMMGDLSASVLKRNFGIKDFGKIFPGHGGVMDRFDSTLFTLPFTFVIVRIMQAFV
ncbi:MAG: phosphatidate cytidylyltransferase [Eubacterium sp.]